MNPEIFPIEKAASQNMASLVSSAVIFLSSSTHPGNLAFSMFSNTHGFYFPSYFHGHVLGLVSSL